MISALMIQATVNEEISLSMISYPRDGSAVGWVVAELDAVVERLDDAVVESELD